MGIKIFLKLILVMVFISGCSSLHLGKSTIDISNSSENKEFSCEEKVKPKSLQYIEQQYRCTGN